VIVGGIKFYERKEIKDIMAYLRVLVNPRDSVSLARIINVPNRGIGQVTLARLRQFAEDQGVSMSEGLDRADEIAGLNAGAKMRLQAFRDLINLLRERSQKMRIAELITLVAEKSGYLEQLKALGTIEAVARTENIEELVASGYEFEERSEEPTLKRFLEEVSLVMDIDMWDDTREAVSLMTLHNAKGLEFPVVFIAGAEEGLLPHHTSFEDEQELEEERRLFYVGMTRAKEHLIISLASGRRGFRGWMPQVASRFLDSLPQGLVEVLMPAGDSCQQGDRHLDDGEEKLVTIGARVRHPEWGLGTVTGCEGYGRELRLTVRFGRGITKKVMACYARLEILDDD
jgi:DNA helicase-2/ATP-dependent DNA helicase PcrA